MQRLRTHIFGDRENHPPPRRSLAQTGTMSSDGFKSYRNNPYAPRCLDAKETPAKRHNPHLLACLLNAWGASPDPQFDTGYRTKLCKHILNGRCENTSCTFAHSIWTLRCPQVNACNHKKEAAQSVTAQFETWFDDLCAEGAYDATPQNWWTPQMRSDWEHMRAEASNTHVSFHKHFRRMLIKQLKSPKRITIGKKDVTAEMMSALRLLLDHVDALRGKGAITASPPPACPAHSLVETIR